MGVRSSRKPSSQRSAFKPSFGSGKSAQKSLPGLAVRVAAAHFYRDVVFGHKALDRFFDPDFGDPLYINLASHDRALVRAIITTALRRRQTLLHGLSSMLEKPLPRKAEMAEAILVTAMTQILYMEVADHATVSLAVETAARHHDSKGFKGLINAILRRVIRERDRLLQDDDCVEIPDWLYQRWQKHYGSEATASILAMLREEPGLDLTVKNDPDRWAELMDGHVMPNGTVRLPRSAAVRTLPGFNEGSWWIQDVSATLAVHLFGDVTGLHIADLCAAPGGKTAQLIAKGAKVSAFDISQERMQRLQINMKRLNYNVQCSVHDSQTELPQSVFDGVLLDAPCSSTGVIRRHPDILYHKSERDILALARLQKRLLKQAIASVKKGGYILYATCSLEPEEGEMQIAALIHENAPICVEAVQPCELFGLDNMIQHDGTVRCLPHYLPHDNDRLSGMDGFFIARLKKL